MPALLSVEVRREIWTELQVLTGAFFTATETDDEGALVPGRCRPQFRQTIAAHLGVAGRGRN